MSVLEILRAGPLTTVQDLGRPGWAHLGVPHSGALDPSALRAANRLVGNPPDAAGLETTLGGCAVRFTVAVTVAVTGAAAPVTLDGAPVSVGTGLSVAAGSVVEVGPATVGVRNYIAVAGGFGVTRVLGSRATDTLSGLGPPPLADGDRVALGGVRVHALPGPAVLAWDPPAAGVITVHVTKGPRDDWLTDEAMSLLLATSWTISAHSNRVGLRLDGPSLARARTDELPSEGLVLGAVQVPSGGTPLVFLADHPTTGGYPVVAVVDAVDLALLAQARPGSRMTFAEAAH